VKDSLEAYIGSKYNFYVIYNPVILVDAKDETDEDDRIIKKYDIVWVGRFSEQKDPFRFVSLVEKLRGVKIDLCCLMVGDGELQDPVLNYIHNNDYVWLNVVGFQRNMSEIYSTAKALVSTSKWEGFGLVCIEANLKGIPFLYPSELTVLDELIDIGCAGYCYTDDNFCDVSMNVLSENSTSIGQDIDLSVFDIQKWGNDINLLVHK